MSGWFVDPRVPGRRSRTYRTGLKAVVLNHATGMCSWHLYAADDALLEEGSVVNATRGEKACDQAMKSRFPELFASVEASK